MKKVKYNNWKKKIYWEKFILIWDDQPHEVGLYYLNIFWGRQPFDSKPKWNKKLIKTLKHKFMHHIKYEYGWFNVTYSKLKKCIQ